MAKVKCSKCGKKNDDTAKKCSKCGKKIYKEFDANLWIIIVCGCIQVLLSMFLLFFSKRFYSGVLNDLVWLFGMSILLIIISLLMFVFCGKKKIKNILFYFVLIFFVLFGGIFLYRTVVAFKYDNCYEIYKLAAYYSSKEAKIIKNNINNIFEYDNSSVFSRDIIIDSFYNDEEFSVLYLNDSYGNYKLKFYLTINDLYDLIDIYYIKDDMKFYLVSDGKKTENFEFYYAMYILDNVLGEELNGFATIEQAIEKNIVDDLEVSANIMFNYENLVYDAEQNSFSFNGNAYNMDYYSNMVDINYTVTFRRKDEKVAEPIWYYGDSSFDYVEWNFNI